MKATVVDCKGHLKGRLASVVAKQLLKGHHIVLVRCEEANVSGSFIRNKIQFLNYLNKTMRTNPSRGHRHFRAPSMMIYKAIRGMVPHKTARGAEALKRLHVYDGCPPRYSRVKKMVIPDALRALVMKPSSKYIRLGDLASQMGWNYGPLIHRLEKERLHYAKIWYHRKVRALKKHQQGLKAYRHLIKSKKAIKAKKAELKKKALEKKAEEKKEEGAEKKEEKKIVRKKHTHRANRRRLHKLAVIKKVNRLEAAAKKRSQIKKAKAAAEKKKQRAAAARKARNLKKEEKIQQKKKEAKARAVAKAQKAAKKAQKAKAAKAKKTTPKAAPKVKA